MTILRTNDGNPISNSNPIPVKQTDSDIMLPIEIQGRLQTTTQTHNAVSVAGSGNSINTSWIDCFGFDKVAMTLLSDASTTNSANLLWSNDGATQHGFEQIITSSTGNTRSGISETKARYLKVQILNGDASAHTMSAWIFLKA